ncbi:hypothetical protein GCM10023349_39960 [Nocardioides conyzicola]|uniref:Uncharacterized protein n=1 Tax=Nocardioides conyzicola TaxID=1651781 RepID=A0ABP8XV65_9ACTN
MRRRLAAAVEVDPEARRVDLPAAVAFVDRKDLDLIHPGSIPVADRVSSLIGTTGRNAADLDGCRSAIRDALADVDAILQACDPPVGTTYDGRHDLHDWVVGPYAEALARAKPERPLVQHSRGSHFPRNRVRPNLLKLWPCPARATPLGRTGSARTCGTRLEVGP